jgi:hypothetical protein
MHPILARKCLCMFQIHDGTLGVREGKNNTYQATCVPRHPLYGSPLDTWHKQGITKKKLNPKSIEFRW